jgi:broad specificity phosphatase PhoE
MPKLILTRHGQTDYNVQGRWQGHIDIPLNREGLRQARALANRLTHFQIDAAYTSPLSRASVTADMLLEKHPSGVKAVRLDNLRETNGGAFEGLTRQQTIEKFPEVVEKMRIDRTETGPPGGETLSQVCERVKSVLARILEEHPEKEKNVLVVAHGGVMGVTLCHMMAMELGRIVQWRIDNCSLTLVDYSWRGGIMTLFNDTNHLLELTEESDTNLQPEKEGSHNPVVEGVNG